MPDRAVAAWSPSDEFCVVEPRDGGNGSSVSFGSGRQVADRIVHVVVERWHAKAALIVSRAAPLPTSAARRCAYTIVPTILEWERHENPLMHAERVSMEVAIARRGEPQPLRWMRFEMNVSRPRLLVTNRVSLPKQFDDALIRLLSPD